MKVVQSLALLLLTVPILVAFTPSSSSRRFPTKNFKVGVSIIISQFLLQSPLIPLDNIVLANDVTESVKTITEIAPQSSYKFGDFKLPYLHENLKFDQFLGSKATIVFNMKIDDSQTPFQFPSLAEIYRKYKNQGLAVHAFPSEQGWFEADDDETIREKSTVYYNFGDPPKCSVFDKIDLLGPSAHPLYRALTKTLPTPNGYERITLNYEKFLLDADGNPVRRYPRKFSAYDMEPDITALLKGEPLPEESEMFKKAWREAKREAVKSEYAFRYNYNYYTAPDSMYKYDTSKDK
jgi:glutathione peroxidase